MKYSHFLYLVLFLISSIGKAQDCTSCPAGSPVDLTATYPTAVSFTWVCDNGFTSNVANPTFYPTTSTTCILTAIDAGGYWVQQGVTPQDISGLLVGESPCINWDSLACGKYTLMYIVGDQCCRDTATISPIKCCLTGISNCN